MKDIREKIPTATTEAVASQAPVVAGGESQRDGSGSPSSHDYARNLQSMAEALLSRPAFVLPWSEAKPIQCMGFYADADKQNFLDAVKALGSGKKEFSDSEVQFRAELSGGLLILSIPRNILCRLIRPAEYECIPFLTPEEEAQLGNAGRL